MRVISLILSYFFICEISAHTLKKIEGIKNEIVTNVKFDAEGNSYVVTKSEDGNRFRLYKLNSSNEISSVKDLPYVVSDILVNSQGDVYLHSLDDVLAIIRANSTAIQVIAEKSNKLFHLDDNGNLFHDKGYDDVYVLRLNSNASAKIKELKTFGIDPNKWTISDKSGNTYFLAGQGGKFALAVVTKEDLLNEIPNAAFVNFINGRTHQLVTEFEVDNNGVVWVATTEDSKTAIKKYSNGNLKTIRTDDYQGDIKIIPAKEKTYILKNREIYYVKPNDEVVELKKLTSDFFWTKGFVDSEGQAYFFYRTVPNHSGSSDFGKLVTIKANEAELIPITFGKYPKSVKTASLDFNNDVWIVTTGSDDIYHLKKGETAANAISKNEEYQDRHVNVNFVTKKIYVGSMKGLFIVEKN